MVLIKILGAGDCDLSVVPGLFKEVNGKFTYDENYKLKRGRKNPANGETLVNPGKILKGRAFLRPTALDQEFTGNFLISFFPAYNLLRGNE